MHAQNGPKAGQPVEGPVRRLTMLLEKEGLVVAVRDDGAIQVRNPAGYVTSDPRGRALNPGLEQRVTAVECDGGLWWAWIWIARDAAPEIEAMVPIGDVDEAARRIARVLRVDEHEGTER